MAQGYKKTLRQGSPPDKSKQYDRSPDSYYPGSIKREIYLLKLTDGQFEISTIKYKIAKYKDSPFRANVF
jgi:hypothetical protein